MFFLKKIQSFSFSSLRITSWAKIHYLFIFCFIFGWWLLAFQTDSTHIPSSCFIAQNLSLKTSALLEELTPLQRDALKKALAGNFSLMTDFIVDWEKDADLLERKGVKGIKRLPADKTHQALLIGRLLDFASPEILRFLNCKLNLNTIADDHGRQFIVKDDFQHFLPQTYLSASFLLSIAPPHEIVALPKGLRHCQSFFSPDHLSKVSRDINQLSGEKLSLEKPDIAFVAPYSHPLSLETLRNQKVPLYSINHIDQVDDIQSALLKIGHVSNHILEAQLLAIFMEASFLALDNRLLALNDKKQNQKLGLKQLPKKLDDLLFLTHRQNYALPTLKSLSGQLMARALKLCNPHSKFIPESLSDWSIPIEHEAIVQKNPDCIIVSTIHPNDHNINRAWVQTKAFQSNQIFYLDENVQESPTQFIVLAYFDIYHTLSQTQFLQ